MAQASQRSLITPLARFIFSSLFSFSFLALYVGGFLKPSEVEKRRKKKNFTLAQKHKLLFLTKSNGFMTVTTKKTTSLESMSFSLISDEDTPI